MNLLNDGLELCITTPLIWELLLVYVSFGGLISSQAYLFFRRGQQMIHARATFDLFFSQLTAGHIHHVVTIYLALTHFLDLIR